MRIWVISAPSPPLPLLPPTQPAKDDPECVKVLAMPQGIIMCVDRRYEDWFGKGIETVTGHPLASIVQEQVRQ